MAFNDAFGIFGHYAFSSKPTHGRSIYESLSDGMGDSYNSDFSSLQSARLYADSMCLAHAQYQLDRALNNRDVSKATELLTQLEKDYQVSPGQRDTLKQRRDFLSAMIKVSRGNSQSVIESALGTLLGSNFVAYEHLTPTTFPPSPGDVGVFAKTNEIVKQFAIGPAISTIGTPISVAFYSMGDSATPMPGERYTVDPNPLSTIEQITIISVGVGAIEAIFSRAHEAGTVAVTPYPFWISSARYSRVVVTLSVAQDPETRRKINELMARASRGVSQWGIVSDQGSLILDSPVRGIIGSSGLG